ncbi:FHA domain-containing protein [Naumannella halotolerans]|uniref:Zinc ribbon protein n=1 Tax=Naumannella halotolerans TaxID=993414 RepID=A0A4R7J7A3_9ACTN|nr:FHA domain-containing protein [Naumannella halotolerans]TDT33311.1 zinc ribbon protein [Naumannella halotolerans]
MPYCTNCGHNNPDGANFCARCGEPIVRPQEVENTEVDAFSDSTRVVQLSEDSVLGDLSADDEKAIDDLPQDSALLIVHRGGPGVRSRFLIDNDTTTVGRHPQADIFFDDITVSRHHAEFRRTDSGIVVADLGSLNGTYVNRALVDGEAPLKSGDEVQIGKFRMLFFASSRGVG